MCAQESTRSADDVLTFEVTLKVRLQAANAGEAWQLVDYDAHRHLFTWDIKTESVTLIDGTVAETPHITSAQKDTDG